MCAAIAERVEHGGYCPKGRIAEDGPIPTQFKMTESTSPDYTIRTKMNVMSSAATLILITDAKQLKGGTKLTQRLCIDLGVPHALVNPTKYPIEAVVDWLIRDNVQILNVAGPRESKVRGIQGITFDYMRKLIRIWKSKIDSSNLPKAESEFPSL